MLEDDTLWPGYQVVAIENRSPTGQRLPNSYRVVAFRDPERTAREAAKIVKLKVWSWEEIEREGPSWDPPGYRCEGIIKSGDRCKRVVFGARRCRWHKDEEAAGL